MSTGIQPIRTFKPPVVAADLNPGRFIKAESFNGKRCTYKIAAIPEMEELEGKDSKKQVRGIVSFVGVELKWVLNTTNIVCLTAMFGKVLAGWVGKRVTLFEGSHDNAPAIRVWGSPDIAGEMEVLIALPRRRAYNMTMHRVVLGGKKAVGGNRKARISTPATQTPSEPKQPDLRAALDEAEQIFQDKERKFFAGPPIPETEDDILSEEPDTEPEPDEETEPDTDTDTEDIDIDSPDHEAD